MNDIVERLEAANPFPTDTEVERPTRSSDSLFAELTNTVQVDTADTSNIIELTGRQLRRDIRRRVLTIAAALAAAVAITIGALVAGPGSTTAQAALTRAAQAAAGFESGRADVQIVSTGAVGQLPVTAESTFTYNGDDYRFVETGDRPDTSTYVLEMRRVGDRFYWASPGSPGQYVTGPLEDFTSFASLEMTFAFSPQAAGLDTFGPVLASADNLSQQDNGATSVFIGSISRDALVGLDPSQVPPGLAIIVGTGAAELPPQVALRATVIDGVLNQLEIMIDGESPSGPMTAQITTTLSGLGNTAPIQNPDADTLLDIPMANSPEELEAMGASETDVAEYAAEIAIYEELAARRPRLCIEFGTSMPEGPVMPDQMVILISEFETLANCYRDAGEPAVAEIARRGGDNWSRTLEQTLALEDVEARRPGLCTEHQFWKSNASQQEILDTRAAHIDCLADAGEARAAAAVQNHRINFLDQLPDE